MIKNIIIEAITKVILGFVLIGALIFIPAGNIMFKNGWLLIMILFIPMVIIGIVMMIKNPELLKKRLNAKEEQKGQKIVVKLSGLMFVMGFIVAGFTHRFGWHTVNDGVVIVACFIFLIGYGIYLEVIRENAYLSRTVKICENQKVVDTGLYAVIRHPMYLATIFMFLSMPLILGSIYSFIIFCFYPFIIVMRIKKEEEFLKKELSGYSEYLKKVKYRLIPFIW